MKSTTIFQSSWVRLGEASKNRLHNDATPPALLSALARRGVTLNNSFFQCSTTAFGSGRDVHGQFLARERSAVFSVGPEAGFREAVLTVWIKLISVIHA